MISNLRKWKWKWKVQVRGKEREVVKVVQKSSRLNFDLDLDLVHLRRLRGLVGVKRGKVGELKRKVEREKLVQVQEEGVVS